MFQNLSDTTEETGFVESLSIQIWGTQDLQEK